MIDMLDSVNNTEHLGELEKAESVWALQEAGEFLEKEMTKYDTELSYDVTAREQSFFKTINYTEYAGCLMICPLQFELRDKQMFDALYGDPVPAPLDFIPHFKSKIESDTANKYKGRNSSTSTGKRLVVLAGSNVLKTKICLDKLRAIGEKDDVLFKPHPITTHTMVGELKDLFGSTRVADRDSDLYAMLPAADIVYTSHVSESALYAVCLGKQIEPIDAYGEVFKGSFYHLNKWLFSEENPTQVVNKLFNSYKSGLICPALDPDWKLKIVQYLEYIHKERDKYANFYIT